jgi:hypothetical protein
MPLIYRILGYGGNAVLFAFGLIALIAGAVWPALFLVVVGGLNLYLIRKIDLYSREEVWLQAEVRKRELRRQIEEMDKEEAARAGLSEPKRISAASDREKPSG